MVTLLRLAEAPLVLRPPPTLFAEFPVTVTVVRLSWLPKCMIPPPFSVVVLPLITELTMVIVDPDSFRTPPPWSDVVWLSLITLSVMDNDPKL